MRKFYIYFKNENERNYYINKCIKNNLSVRGLINEIKTKSFDRLSYADKKHIKLITDKETSKEDIEICERAGINVLVGGEK